MSLLKFIVRDLNEKQKGIRVDQWLAAQEGLPSRSQQRLWFEEKRVRRAGIALSPSDRVAEGDEIEVDIPEPKNFSIEARPLDLKIYYEDQDLIVLYKPRGISMHPGASKGDPTTLVHALLAHSEKLSSRGGEFRPGIVHRLDKDTEGIVVVAKTNEVHEKLSQQFAERQITRHYWALCLGKFPNQLGVDAPIGRHPVHRKKMTVTPKGRASRTYFERLDYFDEGYSWLKCKLYSGRTHQIRVHLSYKKHPVLNDSLYGGAWEKRLKHLSDKKRKALEDLEGQALVAYELGFRHPRTNQTLHFSAEMPSWLKCLTKK